MRSVLPFVLVLALVPGPALAAELPPGGTFIDDDGSVHQGYVEALAAARITFGCAPIRYCPEEPVTRAQMAAFLLRALDHDVHAPPYRGIFGDVPSGAWYARLAEHLVDHDLTVGCALGRYCPEDSVTRAQMASFLVRAFDLPQVERDAFSDDDGDVHEADIDALAAAGFTVGCAPGGYCPEEPVTRAQMASFLGRALALRPVDPPPFLGTVQPVDEEIRARMAHSWEPGCPVGLEDLRYLRVHHWGFDGQVREGELVVHRDHARSVVGVLRILFGHRFPIERMELVDEYQGDDLASMEANNTSAFNCREVQSRPGVWSQHAFGWAIDINPVQNPYVSGYTVLPEAGRAYLDRSLDHPGMIHDGDEVVGAFAEIGWGWGGHWTSIKDYQHFSATGR